MSELVTAAISAATSVLVVLITYGLNAYRESRLRQAEDAQRVLSTYLNPLRLSLVENYFRLDEILRHVGQHYRHPALLTVDGAEAVSEQSPEWFNAHGCYLMSCCYLTARLFYHLDHIRQELAYLPLSRAEDTELITLVTALSRCFREGYGVYYLLQPSMGRDVYLTAEQRLMTYREFCQRLSNPQERVWFDRLIAFYLETGQGQQPQRVEQILAAIRTLSAFLDQVAGGGNSIQERFEAEGFGAM